MFTQGDLFGLGGETLPVTQFTELAGQQVHACLQLFAVVAIQFLELVLRGFQQLLGLFVELRFQCRFELGECGFQSVMQALLAFGVASLDRSAFGLAGLLSECQQLSGQWEIVGPGNVLQQLASSIGLLFAGCLHWLQLFECLAGLVESANRAQEVAQRQHALLVGFLLLLADAGVPGCLQPTVFLGFLQGVEGRGRGRLGVWCGEFGQGFCEQVECFLALAGLLLVTLFFLLCLFNLGLPFAALVHGFEERLHLFGGSLCFDRAPLIKQ